MGRWSERAEELLYDGETIDEQIEISTATVVVTSHRVLAFTPEREGANFQQADRPNVTGVTLEAGGETKFLRWAARAAIYGLVLVVAGTLLPIDDILSGVALPSTTGQLGIGGVLRLFERMLSILRNLDDLMQLFGVLLLLFAIVPTGVYLWSRERSLAIDIAGEAEPLRLPVPATDGETISARLEAAIRPEIGDDAEMDTDSSPTYRG
jgi:hypothetical protein